MRKSVARGQVWRRQLIQARIELNSRTEELDQCRIELGQANSKLETCLEQLKLERRRLNFLQLPLVPDKLKTFDAHYALAYAYEPAFKGTAMGGDFYDVFRITDGKCGIVIGDVCGKGAEAVFLAMSARSMLRAFSSETSDPSGIMSKTEQALCSLIAERNEDGFVTAFLLVLKHEDGTFSYSNAGHEPAIIWRAESGNTEIVRYGAPPLCVGQKEYPAYRNHLHPGDKIVLFTDGLTEVARGSQMLGVEGVSEILSEVGALSAEDLLRTILVKARTWSDQSRKDDIAIVVLERTG